MFLNLNIFQAVPIQHLCNFESINSRIMSAKPIIVYITRIYVSQKINIK